MTVGVSPKRAAELGIGGRLFSIDGCLCFGYIRRMAIICLLTGIEGRAMGPLSHREG